MTPWKCAALLPLAAAALLMSVSCDKAPEGAAAEGVDAKVGTLGSLEVTAKLEEIPEGAIFKRDLYDYATILKYKMLKIHRGHIHGETIYVAQYNPFKARSEAADRRVKDVGGNLKRFQAGQVHRMAMEVPLEDCFMGGVINKYFGKETGLLYWAIWTNLAQE